MVTALLVVCGAVAAWILADRWLARRERRLQRGRGAWSSQFDHAHRFRSTGFQDTLPPTAAAARAAPRGQAPRTRSTS